jgi:hypothetical protein
MIIKTNRKLQSEVDRHYSVDILKIAKLSKLAASEAFSENEYGKDETFVLGVGVGMELGRRYSELTRGYWGRREWAIYEAMQETSDGPDRFYFIGDLHEIIASLKKLPLAQVPDTAAA